MTLIAERLKGCALVCAAFALCACTTLGPEYKGPEVAWLDDWQSDLYGQLGDPQQQSQIDLSFWWRLFDDPVLNGLMIGVTTAALLAAFQDAMKKTKRAQQG